MWWNQKYWFAFLDTLTLPPPQDGMELLEGSLGGESRLTRHYLHLMDLKPQDTGTYTCAAANPLGAAAANWTLRVIGEEQ